MPSSASPLLRVELQATGEKLNVWGEDLNKVIERLEEAIAGVQAKSLTGNVTLTATNYVSNEYRHSTLVFTDGGLSSAPTVTVPPVEKNWIVHNKGATHNVNISTGSGAAAAVRPGQLAVVYCDGTDCFAADPTLDKIKAPTGPVSLNNQKITNLADGTSDGDAVNRLQVINLTAASVASAAASAAAADASADAAAASEANAAASFDSFDDRYLGAKSSDPSVDNDGNALITGAKYWNSTANEMRVWSGSAWVQTFLPAGDYALKTGDSLTGALNWAPWTDIASATTTDLSTVNSNRVRITGTTTITSFGTGANLMRYVRFAGVLTLTHNATTLFLPSAANITTAADDIALCVSDGSGNWRVISYQRASGAALAGGAPWRLQATVTTTSGALATFEGLESLNVGGLLFVIRGVSHNNGSSQSMTVATTNTSGSYNTALSFGPSVSAATLVYGAVEIFGHKIATGYSMVTANASTSNTGMTGVAPLDILTNNGSVAGTGLGGVRFGWQAGSFDAGSIELWVM